jgi:hypothetical protein
MATELSANNPDLIESIRRNIGRPNASGNNNASSENNPDESSGMNYSLYRTSMNS